MAVRDNVIPLSDGAGEVIEVGSGVTRVKVGDKVAGNFFQRWPGGEPPPDVQSTALGGGIDGMLAEYVVLEEEGDGENSSAPFAGGGRDAALRRRDRLARHDGARQDDSRPDRAAARHRRRLGVRPAVRPRDGHAGRHHLVERRQSSPRRRSSAPATPSTTRPRRTGTRRRWNSPAAAASITSSRSAAPARSRNRSARSASAARSA